MNLRESGSANYDLQPRPKTSPKKLRAIHVLASQQPFEWECAEERSQALLAPTQQLRSEIAVGP